MDAIVERCAGLDVHLDTVVACVLYGKLDIKTKKEVKTFSTTTKGLLELFISHGLPKEIDKAKFIIGQTDYINAEAWNMRFGVELWRRLSLQEGLDTEVVPYYLMNLSKMESDKFFDIISEIFANTKKGRQLKQKI